MEGGRDARPSSSFGRPSTSRPGTSFGQAYHPHGHADIEPTYEVEEEYEEESDDEDVFAFLPPSTADQEPEREQDQQEIPGQGQPQGLAPYYYPQLQHQNPFAHDPFIPSSLPSTTNSAPFGAPDSAGNSYANYAFATLQYADRAPSQPQPSINPTIAAAETPHPFAQRDISGLGAQPMGQTQVQGSGGYLHPPPLSPPSTDSQPSTGYGASAQDSYQLKRMSASVPDVDKGKEGAGIKLRMSVVNEEVESPTSRSNAGSPLQAIGKGGDKGRVSGEKSRKSREEQVKDADTSAVTTEVDLGVDLEGGIDGDATVKDVNRSRSRDRRKKKRSADHRSAGASGVNPSPAVGTGEGLRRRSKNVNASPYYAYAQFNNARNGLGKSRFTNFLYLE